MLNIKQLIQDDRSLLACFVPFVSFLLCHMMLVHRCFYQGVRKCSYYLFIENLQVLCQSMLFHYKNNGKVACVRNIVSEGFEGSQRTCPVQALHTGETILYDSTDTQRLTREIVQRENAELEQTESLSPPSHSLSYSLLFSFSFVFISARYVWFVVLLVTASVSRSFSSCYLLCLSFSGSPAYLFILGSPCLSPLPPSHSLSPLIAYAFIPLRLPAH